MIRKSVQRFSGRIMLNQRARAPLVRNDPDRENEEPPQVYIYSSRLRRYN
jgi:hypothetical protein